MMACFPPYSTSIILANRICKFGVIVKEILAQVLAILYVKYSLLINHNYLQGPKALLEIYFRALATRVAVREA